MADHFAYGFLALVAVAAVFMFRFAIRVSRERLFCGECGVFTEDLTDDDVCHRCARKLAPQPRSERE